MLMLLDTSLQIIPRKSIVEKQKHETSVSECNKLCTFIKSLVGINITVIPKIEFDHVKMNLEKL